MQGFNEVPDFLQPAPPGWYLSRIQTAEPHQKKGDGEKFSMIHVIVEIIDPRYAGQQAHHYITTDARSRTAAVFAKQALRGMGMSDADFALNIDDQQLCQALLGRELFVKYSNEPVMQQDSTGEYNKKSYAMDYKLNKEVELQRLRIETYATQNLFSKIQAAGGIAPTLGQAAPGSVAASPNGHPPQPAALPQGYQPLQPAATAQPVAQPVAAAQPAPVAQPAAPSGLFGGPAPLGVGAVPQGGNPNPPFIRPPA